MAGSPAPDRPALSTHRPRRHLHAGKPREVDSDDQDKITFYHAAPSRSSIVHWMLEEVGALPDRAARSAKGEQKAPAYLALNPMGKVPAIVHRGVVITEVAAICCYLAEAFPEAGLAPPVGDAQRGTYLRWLFFGRPRWNPRSSTGC